MRTALAFSALAVAVSVVGAQRQNLPLLPPGPSVGLVYGQASDVNATDRGVEEFVKAGTSVIAVVFNWNDIESVRAWGTDAPGGVRGWGRARR
jgi:hypothetical protein